VICRSDDLHEVGCSPGRHKTPPSLVVGASGDAVVIGKPNCGQRAIRSRSTCLMPARR
jgi:hypothetical protein